MDIQLNYLKPHNMRSIFFVVSFLLLSWNANSQEQQITKALQSSDIWIYKSLVTVEGENTTSSYAQYELTEGDTRDAWMVVYVPLTYSQATRGSAIPKTEQKFRAVIDGQQLNKATCIPDVVSGSHLLLREKCEPLSVGQTWRNIEFRNVELLDGQFRITSRERVETDAGTFDAFKIEEIATFYVKSISVKNGELAGYESLENPDCVSSKKKNKKSLCIVSRKSKNTYWYAPEINVIIKSTKEIDTMYKPKIKSSDELVFFTAHDLKKTSSGE